jgi:hypothetical protein
MAAYDRHIISEEQFHQLCLLLDRAPYSRREYGNHRLRNAGEFTIDYDSGSLLVQLYAFNTVVKNRSEWQFEIEFTLTRRGNLPPLSNCVPLHGLLKQVPEGSLMLGVVYGDWRSMFDVKANDSYNRHNANKYKYLYDELVSLGFIVPGQKNSDLSRGIVFRMKRATKWYDR